VNRIAKQFNNMNKKKVCIIGCGTYGSYLLKRLIQLYKEKLEITVIEIGNEKIKSEEEIGIRSESRVSNVAKYGRYFGLGGTSARWGGQILFFDERDNLAGDLTWKEIIKVNQQYEKDVLRNLLNTQITKTPNQNEKDIKTGIWLKYKRRNMYRQITKSELNGVKIIKGLRVVDFILNGSIIDAVICKSEKGELTTVKADIFYITTGAIESCRLLMYFNQKYHILKETDIGKHFGDHLSVELFKIINSKPILKGVNFLPTLKNGSLITKRIIVYSKDGRIGYLHPIFNKDVKVFTSIKNLLFGKQKADFKIKDIFQGLEFLFRFSCSVFFLKKLYAHRNNWSLQLDIEQPFPNNNTLTLSDDLDNYGEKIVQINWKISDQDTQAMIEIQKSTVKLLEENGLKFIPVFDPKVTANKIEDIYHPVGILRMGGDDRAVIDFNSRVKNVRNLFHFSTGLFPSAKSINPTAAAFCFIEKHLNDFEDFNYFA
jgi:hypothetical protein